MQHFVFNGKVVAKVIKDTHLRGRCMVFSKFFAYNITTDVFHVQSWPYSSLG